ncbi:hypothetical protein L4F38_19100, partial [Vibrio paracholerae]|nr:hypothetical protein [Vibrio paracholerae]
MNKKLLVGGWLLSVIALFFVGKRGGEELSLPVCDSVPKVDTPVHFFTDSSITEERIEEFIDYSNLVLENSCIPIRRTLSGITNIDLTSFKSQDSGKLHQQLVLNVGNSILEPMQKIGSYYVLVLPKDFPFAKDSAGIA